MGLKDILCANGVDTDAANKFYEYYRMLIEWNEKINLTAIIDETDVAYKHFLDCICIFGSNVIKKGAKVIDVGSGAGFPGIPMKLTDAGLDMTLADSLGKRVNFLNEVKQQLQLEKIVNIHGRAEDLAKNPEYRERYDVCVSRAVANMATLTELCVPFVKVGGYFVAMKGPKAEEELDSAKNAIRLLGGRLENTVEYTVPGTEYSRTLVVVKKISETSAKYPRKAPKPSKAPLI